MPFRSDRQRKYFEANKAKLISQGVDVKEWEQANKGLKLPKRLHPKRPPLKKSKD